MSGRKRNGIGERMGSDQMKGKIVSQLHTGIVFIEAEDGTEYIFFWKEAEGAKIKVGRNVRFTPGEPKNGGKYPYAYSVVVEKTFTDVMKVVRCKDCINWDKQTHLCDAIDGTFLPDWFCAYGKIEET